MHITLTARKQLAAIFVGASLIAGCSPPEKSHQKMISDDVYARLSILTEAQKPYLNSEQYQLQKSRDECSADHIAENQMKAEDIITTLRKGRSDEEVSATQREIEELMPVEALTIMIACNQDYKQPPSLIFNVEPR